VKLSRLPSPGSLCGYLFLAWNVCALIIDHKAKTPFLGAVGRFVVPAIIFDIETPEAGIEIIDFHARIGDPGSLEGGVDHEVNVAIVDSDTLEAAALQSAHFRRSGLFLLTRFEEAKAVFDG